MKIRSARLQRMKHKKAVADLKAQEAAAAEEAARLEEQQKSSAPRRGRAPHLAAATAEWAGVCTAALTCWLLRRHGASRRGWHFF